MSTAGRALLQPALGLIKWRLREGEKKNGDFESGRSEMPPRRWFGRAHRAGGESRISRTSRTIFSRGLVSLWIRLRLFAERSRRARHLPEARLRQQLLDPC